MINKIKKVIVKIRNAIYILGQENAIYKEEIAISHVTHCIGANVGDNVLSYCTRAIFKYFIGIRKWNIITVERPVNSKIINKINKSGGAIIGGGGLFLPDTNHNTISGWIWSVNCQQISEINRPIIIFSVGYNYFRGQIPNQIFKDNITYLIRQSSFVGLGNYGSVNKIQEIVGPELAEKIVYQPCTTTLINKFIPKSPKSKGHNIVAVNIAFDRKGARFGENEIIILRQVAEAIKLIENRGYKIIFVAHYNLDLEFIHYLEDANVSFTIKNLSNRLPREAIDFYRGVGIVLGMRGHAQMIPFGLNCEIISLGTHDKLKWFLEDIDALDWYIELNEETESLKDRILETFIRVHEVEAELTQKRLVEKQDELWRITCGNMEIIKSILKRNGSFGS